MISKEERAEWREHLAEFEVIANIISDRDDNWIRRAVRALDALEQAEAERDALAEMHGRYIYCADVRKHIPCLEEQRRTGMRRNRVAVCPVCGTILQGRSKP